MRGTERKADGERRPFPSRRKKKRDGQRVVGAIVIVRIGVLPSGIDDGIVVDW